MAQNPIVIRQKKPLRVKLYEARYLLLLLLPGLIYYIVFHYAPMYGIIIAFKNYKGNSSMLAAPWVGLKWFEEFFNSYYFTRLLSNTLLISLYNLIFGFPIPIVFALALHEMQNRKFRKIVQTVSYLPHFISVVVVVGMLQTMLSPTNGVVNNIIRASGGTPVNFMGTSKYFRPLYIGSGIWQSFGWNSIIYLAALTGVDPALYEAAYIDGANRWQKIIHVSVPSIMPTMVILLIMQLGRTMSVGYEKIILMYTPANYEVADVISTYVYRRGIVSGQFSFSTAVGLFNSVVNLVLLLIVNTVSRRLNDVSLW